MVFFLVNNQAYLLLIFTLIGSLIGFIFDLFRVLRIVYKTSNFVTCIEDLTFWITTGFIILYSIFIFNNGEIRFFMFIGMGIGLILYIFIFSVHIVNLNVLLLKFASHLIFKILRLLFYPIKTIFRITNKLTQKIFIKLKSLAKN